jgi:uncharacterized protein
MNPVKCEQVLLRIFIGESYKQDGKPLYRWIVEKLRHEKISGATVLRGILGYGPASGIHNVGILRLSQDLPIVIEAVDTEDNINRILPVIEENIGSGLITLQKVEVIKNGTDTKNH